MNKKKISMFVILSLSIATVVMGTTGMSLVSPVFAGGDHNDGGRNARTMMTTTVTIQKRIKNYRQKLNVKMKIQTKITAMTMTTSMS